MGEGAIGRGIAERDGNHPVGVPDLRGFWDDLPYLFGINIVTGS
jgi:hypothetical protein